MFPINRGNAWPAAKRFFGMSSDRPYACMTGEPFVDVTNEPMAAPTSATLLASVAEEWLVANMKAGPVLEMPVEPSAHCSFVEPEPVVIETESHLVYSKVGAEKGYTGRRIGEKNMPRDNFSNVGVMPCSGMPVSQRPRKRKGGEIRKRTRDEANWKINKRKRLLNSGQEYVSVRGQLVPAKQFRGLKEDCCKRKCSSKISLDEAEGVFRQFWALGDHDAQSSFILKCIEEKPLSKRRSRAKQNPNGVKRDKLFSRRYTVQISNLPVDVCKDVFLTLLGITSGRVNKTLRLRRDNGGILPPDRRGKHTKRFKKRSKKEHADGGNSERLGMNIPKEPAATRLEHIVTPAASHVDPLSIHGHQQAVHIGGQHQSMADPLNRDAYGRPFNPHPYYPIADEYVYGYMNATCHPFHHHNAFPYFNASTSSDQLRPEAQISAVYADNTAGASDDAAALQSRSRKRRKGEGRKRTRDESNWKMNKRKVLKNSGQEYLSVKGYVVPAKEFRGLSEPCCQKQCTSRVTTDEAQRLFKAFWDLSDHDRQSSYIASCIEEKTVTRHRPSNKDSVANRPERSFSRKYTLHAGSRPVDVCKQMFLSVLGVTSGRVNRVLRMCRENGGVLPGDRRGKYSSVLRKGVKEESLKAVEEHIRSFPVSEPPMYHSDKGMKYLAPDLNIVKMYEMYRQVMEEEGLKPVKEWCYRKVFKTRFRLSFHPPKQQNIVSIESRMNLSLDEHRSNELPQHINGRRS